MSRSSTPLWSREPGSPTGRRRQPYCIYMTVTVHDGVLRSVTLHAVATPAD